MVLHRDEETNELIKTLVDKKKRKKISRLKKAILQKRTFVREAMKNKQKHEENKTLNKKLRDNIDNSDD